jgi:anti-anti-sigma regulatory factor
MEISLWGSLIVGTLPPDVHVVRFTRPRLDEPGEENAAVEDCELFHELQDTVLARLAQRDTVVLNFGLVESVAPVVLRVLFKVREIARACKARLVLCRVSPVLLESSQMLGLFPITSTEEDALRDLIKSRARPVAQPVPSQM